MDPVIQVLFNGWRPLGRVFLVTILAYPCLLTILRLSGHRTLAKLNAFDLVITVALGSTFATLITSPDVSLSQGILAFALLTGLQWIVAKMTVVSPKFERRINGEPILLYHNGHYLRDAMKKARITEEEIKSNARAKGQKDLAKASAVVLETNGDLSIILND
jgi:uncharacterized membrane protein YcaP (DUF421 family)